MPQPKISIIIPVYNTEKYLRGCLDSVLSQTLQDIEIIIVNDVSPDNSQSIIDEYVAKDSRIIALQHTTNKGPGGARNTGIEAAQGEWLLFLDSDDYLRLDTVEILLNASKEYPQLELIIFGIWDVLPDGKLRPLGSMPSSPILLSDTFKEYCIANLNIYHCAFNKLWKRSLFANICFPEYMNAEDFALIPCLFANIKNRKALMLPQRLYFYQWRKDSLDHLPYTKQTAADFGRTFARLQEFAGQLASERRLLLEDKILQEFYDILQREQSQDPEFQSALVEYVPKDLLAKGLWNISNKFQQVQQYNHQVQQNRWYHFGQLSRKRKLWVLARGLSKRLKLYSLLRPLAKVLKRILEQS